MSLPQSPFDTWAAGVKDQTRKQWTNNPAGDLAAGDAELGTPEALRAVEDYRYREQPWMQDTFHFERYRERDVLEIGVGQGTDHAQFARAGARMTGIDLTPRSIELTKRRFDHEGLESQLSVMDAEVLEFSDNSFDAVFSFGVLHHTPDTQRAFEEVRRVLRPGGVFLGGLYNKHSAFYSIVLGSRWLGAVRTRSLPKESIQDRLSQVEYSTSDARPLVKLLTARGLRQDLERAGFSDVSLTRRHLGLGRYTERYRLVDRLGGPILGWYLIHHAR